MCWLAETNFKVISMRIIFIQFTQINFTGSQISEFSEFYPSSCSQDVTVKWVIMHFGKFGSAENVTVKIYWIFRAYLVRRAFSKVSALAETRLAERICPRDWPTCIFFLFISTRFHPLKANRKMKPRTGPNQDQAVRGFLVSGFSSLRSLKISPTETLVVKHHPQKQIPKDPKTIMKRHRQSLPQ